MKYTALTALLVLVAGTIQHPRAEDLAGTVTDAITNNPISGATISVVGTSTSHRAPMQQAPTP